MVVDVVGGGTVTGLLVFTAEVLATAAPVVVGPAEARRDDSAAEGLDEPEHDAKASSTSGDRIRRRRIRKR